MGIDTVLGTAGSVLTPFAELLSNKTVLGIIGLLYVLVKFEGWLNRKAALGVYRQELLLEKERMDLRKEIMKGNFRDEFDFDKIGRHLAKRFGNNPTDDIIKFLDEALDEENFDLKDWL